MTAQAMKEIDMTCRETPWRSDIEWNTQMLDKLKEETIGYRPLKNINVPQARILLIGQVGAGKSSVFNTINTIFRGYVTSQANAGSTERSLTTVFRMYQVRNGKEGRPLNFRLCDTRGIEEDQGMDANEIGYILDGNVPDKYEFNPSMPLSPDEPTWAMCPTFADKIHCVAIVVDGNTIDIMPDKVLEKLKRLQIRMNQRGIPQVVLMTKIDKTCEKVCKDVSCVFKSKAVQDCVDKVSQVIGLPRSHILPFKNYESETELHTSINILTLYTLKTILHFADDNMHNFLDDIKLSTIDMLSDRFKILLVVAFGLFFSMLNLFSFFGRS